jgi:hypothetical protein
VLALAALTTVSQLHAGQPQPANLQLSPGARIAVVSVLDAEVTHFHGARQIENSFLKTYPVNWSVNAMLLAAVRERLAQLGLVGVLLAPSDELSRARESCFLDASLGKGLPRVCERPFARFALEQRVAALIVLGPGRNDSAHATRGRRRDLPEYLRGWCFVTGKGAAASAPQLLNLTELLLIGVSADSARLADREWGGDAGSWSGYQAPEDLKAFPDVQLNQLQPRFAAALQEQAGRLLAHLDVAR